MTIDPSADQTHPAAPPAASEEDESRRTVGDLPAADPVAGTSPDKSAGSFIGPYQLLHLIGEGGMGQVWLAEQQEPVRRHVAIKLIKIGMDTVDMIGRFESERRALALMEHPAIARVFEAGSTPEGRPYFVMEYVAGPPITTYCDENKLNLRQRMDLFIQVCEGVQHAHQKAIIHRDLKPSNILIAEIDGKPMPRIIDFGVAKAMTQGSEAETMFTQAGAMIGTLGYMSPEQAGSAGEDIDTRSDVYSLGVVLYELLVGALPLDTRKLAYYEALQQLRETDSPRPSSRIRTLGAASAETARQRNTDIQALARQLRGDADAIVLKALEKDRTRRYSSPSDLAADIGRYLRNEPVTAHAPGLAYLARKYVRRHRVGISVAVIAMLLLIGFAIAQTIELRNTRLQRDRADRITGFMTNMFKVSDPSESRGNTITVREVLDKASHDVETGLSQDATVRSQLIQVMAQTYLDLGLYTRARALAQEALDIRRHTLGPNDPKTLESMTQLGSILYHEGHDPEAESMLRNTIALEQRKLGADNTQTLDSKDELVNVLERQAHYTEAEKLEREVIAVETSKLGAADLRTFRSRTNLCAALQGESRFVEAEKEYRSLLDDERRTLGDGHPNILATMHNLGNMLYEENHLSEAEAMYRQTLQTEQRVLGPDHPETASTMTALANTVRFEHGGQSEAEALYRKAIEIELRTVGPEHPYTIETREGLANNLSSEHRYAEAEQLLREVLAQRQRTLGPNNTDTLLTGFNLAELEFKEKRVAEAEAGIRQTLSGQMQTLDANDPDTLASKTLLAKILLDENRPQEAEDYARQAFDAQMRVLGPQHDDTQDSLLALAEALTRLGHYDQAKALYTDNIQKITSLPKSDPSFVYYNLAVIAVEAKQNTDAFEALNHAIQTGFNDEEKLRTDEDLKPLRKDPRFARMLQDMQRSAGAGTNKPQ